MIQVDVLRFLIEKGEVRTEKHLSEAIFGKNDSAYQQRVNQDCRMLVERGDIIRRGEGGANDPFKYYISK